MILDTEVLKQRLELARKYFSTRSLKIKAQIREESALSSHQMRYYGRLLRDPAYNQKRHLPSVKEKTAEELAEIKKRIEERRHRAEGPSVKDPKLWDITTRCCFTVVDLTWKIYGDTFIVSAGPITYSDGGFSDEALERLTTQTCKELDKRAVNYNREQIKSKIRSSWR